MDGVTSGSSLPALRTERLELRQVDEARRMVEQAFSDPGIDRVFASTKDANLGSRRVLEKVGMATTSTSAVSGVGYELARADWHGLSA